MLRIIVLVSAALMVGCTDATIGSIGALGESAEIVCYSGGEKIFQDKSTGKVEVMEGGGGWHYKSQNGPYVRTFADCFVTVN